MEPGKGPHQWPDGAHTALCQTAIAAWHGRCPAPCRTVPRTCCGRPSSRCTGPDGPRCTSNSRPVKTVPVHIQTPNQSMTPMLYILPLGLSCQLAGRVPVPRVPVRVSQYSLLPSGSKDSLLYSLGCSLGKIVICCTDTAHLRNADYGPRW